jgi:hypothetical protein
VVSVKVTKDTYCDAMHAYCIHLYLLRKTVTRQLHISNTDLHIIKTEQKWEVHINTDINPTLNSLL